MRIYILLPFKKFSLTVPHPNSYFCLKAPEFQQHAFRSRPRFQVWNGSCRVECMSWNSSGPAAVAFHMASLELVGWHSTQLGNRRITRVSPFLRLRSLSALHRVLGEEAWELLLLPKELACDTQGQKTWGVAGAPSPGISPTWPSLLESDQSVASYEETTRVLVPPPARHFWTNNKRIKRWADTLQSRLPAPVPQGMSPHPLPVNF